MPARPVTRQAPPTLPLLERIRRGIIGDDEVMDGPYGPQRVVYADYTASGRSLDFVEDFVRDHVLPRYANTHTESSSTGLQTTRLGEDARRIILDAVGATEDDLVVFCGSGATAAVTKLVGILELRRLATAPPPPDERPVVFVGPYEHHSNELLRYAGRPLRIGSFSAASNVTGILTDTDRVARLLHAHGALSFWDYAAAAPYIPIRVAESAPGANDHKDAVFVSPHKFVGGPQTPGVLVVRREPVRNPVPTAPGGGTVSFVGPLGHRYLDDPVAREEGATPAIVESIRAGLVVALKQAVGTETIQAAEERHWRHALRSWDRNPAIEILGNHEARRLSIVSFRIRHLHHNYVVALLNDLFDIQARGGCSCAGPYGHRLLAIDAATSHDVLDEVLLGCDGIKPGWIRINFNYFISDTVRDYLIDAVDLIATHGHRALPDYRFDPHTGGWHHRRAPAGPPLSLTDLTWEPDGRPTLPDHRVRAGEHVLAAQLADARTLLTALPDGLDDGPTGLPADFERMRWFHLPPACMEQTRPSTR
jgi:selenocysteine lyase/cysteine desulfurase